MLARLKLLKPLRLSSSASWCQSTSLHSFETRSSFLQTPFTCFGIPATHCFFPFCFQISVLNLSTGAAKSTENSESAPEVDDNPKPLSKIANLTAREANVVQCADVKDKATLQFFAEEDIFQKAEGEDQWKENFESPTIKVANVRSLLSAVSREKPYRKTSVGEERTPHESKYAVASIPHCTNVSTPSSIVHDEPAPDLDTWGPSISPESKDEDHPKRLTTCNTVSTVVSLGEASKELGSETIRNQTQDLGNGKNFNSADMESADARGSREDHAQIEHWKLSYRERVEKVLVDKGFILESKIPAIQDFSPNMHMEQVASHENAKLTEKSSKGSGFLESSKSGKHCIQRENENFALSDTRGTSLDWNSKYPGCGMSSDGGGKEDTDESDAEGSYKIHLEQQRPGHKHIELGIKSEMQANALLMAALDETCKQERAISTEDQRSLEVGIVGAPNSGKSTLLNRLIGTKVSAVSRKTNTTRNEILGVLTEENTQLLFYDTPGLMLDWRGQALRQDMKNRVQSAWMTADHCELLVVLVDAHRHVEKPDPRVQRLVEKLGVEERPSQKRILCLNKVDLVKKKKSLLPLAQEFGQLPGFERIFMISGLKGGGVKDVKEFLLDQAVLRPWEEEPEAVTDMSPSFLAMEIVWEHVLDHLHQELPYELKHERVSWKVLRDGSLRIEQRLLVPTESHKKIVVGKRGENIRKIGMAAHAELNERLGKKVHLFLDVKILSQQMFVSRYENEVDELMEM